MLTNKTLQDLKAFIDENYHVVMLSESAQFIYEPTHYELENFIEGNKKPSFSQTLLKFIDKKGSAIHRFTERQALIAGTFLKYAQILDTSPIKIPLFLWHWPWSLTLMKQTIY